MHNDNDIESCEKAGVRMGDHDLHHCIICGEHKTIGEGIRIISEFICITCETEMIQTDVKDVKYPFFIHQLKRIFIQKNA